MCSNYNLKIPSICIVHKSFLLSGCIVFALSLRSRPFLHSSTLTLILCLILFITCFTLNKGWIKLFPVMCSVAWTRAWFVVCSYRIHPPHSLQTLHHYYSGLPVVVMLMVNLFDLESVRVSKLQRHLFKEAKPLLPV